MPWSSLSLPVFWLVVFVERPPCAAHVPVRLGCTICYVYCCIQSLICVMICLDNSSSHALPSHGELPNYRMLTRRCYSQLRRYPILVDEIDTPPLSHLSVVRIAWLVGTCLMHGLPNVALLQSAQSGPKWPKVEATKTTGCEIRPVLPSNSTKP
eukprot:1196430-Prorocentrum_minimum.AAC.6